MSNKCNKEMGNEGGDGAPLVKLEAVARPELSQSAIMCFLFRSGFPEQHILEPEKFKSPNSMPVNEPQVAPPANKISCTPQLGNKTELSLDKKYPRPLPEGCDKKWEELGSLRILPPSPMPPQLVPLESSETEFHPVGGPTEIESCPAKTETACSPEQYTAMETMKKNDVGTEETMTGFFEATSSAGKESEKCAKTQLADQQKNARHIESYMKIAKILETIYAKDKADVAIKDKNASDTKVTSNEKEPLDQMFAFDANTENLNSSIDTKFLKTNQFSEIHNKSELESKDALEATAHAIDSCFSEKNDNVKDVNKIAAKDALLKYILSNYSLYLQPKENGSGATSEPLRKKPNTESSNNTESGSSAVFKESLKSDSTTSKSENVDLYGASAPVDIMSAGSEFYINLIENPPAEKSNPVKNIETQTTLSLENELIPPRVRHIDCSTHLWYEIVVYPESVPKI